MAAAVVLWPQPARVFAVLRCSCLAAEMRFGSVRKTRCLTARTYLVQRKRKSEVTRKRLGWNQVLGVAVIWWRRKRRRALSIRLGGHAHYESGASATRKTLRGAQMIRRQVALASSHLANSFAFACKWQAPAPTLCASGAVLRTFPRFSSHLRVPQNGSQ